MHYVITLVTRFEGTEAEAAQAIACLWNNHGMLQRLFNLTLEDVDYEETDA